MTIAQLNNGQIEQWVLGALLDLGATKRLLAAANVTNAEFTDRRRGYFEVLRVLAERDRPVSAQSVYAALPTRSPEDLTRLMGLQACNVTDETTCLSYARELRRLAKLRALETLYTRGLGALAAPGAAPEALCGELGAFVSSFTGADMADETGTADVVAIMDDWEAVASGTVLPRLATGIQCLDAAMDGFVPNLNVIGGMPSMGKSALIAEMVMSCLERGIAVGLFGLEDATKWLPKRHIARAIEIPVGHVGVVRLTAEQKTRLDAATERIGQLLSRLYVWRRAGIEPQALLATCRHWIVNRGVKCIFVDHGGEIQHEKHGQERYDLAVASTYRALRDVAINHGVPIVVLAHFNRATETELGGVPTMQSFAETEYIARMARLALGLWQRPGDDRLLCTVLKRTEGQRGVTVALERDEEYALVRRTGGERIDLAAEKAAERRENERRAAERRTRKVTTWQRTCDE